MKNVFILLMVIAFSECSFAQDTTGGTRANIIIPLHKSPAKKTAPGGSYINDTASIKGPALNATDSKLRAAAASKKYRRKNISKKGARLY